MNWHGERACAQWVGIRGNELLAWLDAPFVPSYSGGLGYGRSIGQRNAIQLSQTFQYSPYFLNGFFADVRRSTKCP